MPDDDQETYTRLDGGQPEGAGRESEAVSLWSAFHWQLARSGREVAVADDAPAPLPAPADSWGSLNYDDFVNDVSVAEKRRWRPARRVTCVGYSGRTLARWVVTCAIGCSMGVVAIALAQLTDVLVEWRNGRVAPRERSGFAAFVGLNAVLALAAAGAAVGVAPGAEASGIPVVKAYLNGVRMRGCLSVRVFVVKFFGTALAVGSGASLGPEGPLVHLGAIVGSFFTGGLDPTRCAARRRRPAALYATRRGRGATAADASRAEDERPPPFFHSDVDRRDFLSLGAACGFSAAFGAPIGGVLFSLEEASSFWSTHLLWRGLVGTVLSTFTALALKHRVWRLRRLSHYGLISLAGASDGEVAISLLPLAALVGVLGGVLGAGFNVCWHALMRARRRAGDAVGRRAPDARAAGRRRAALKVADAVLGVAVTSLAFYGAARASSAWACVRASPDVAAWTVDDKFARRFDCEPGHVHELASLWFGSRERAIKKILEAGAGELRGGGLLLSGVLTLATLALVFGNALPGGLFLPLIFCGACLGGALARLASIPDGFRGAAERHVALLGAVSLLAGVQRSTVSLVVIILEGTGNQHLLIPIIVATVCARGAGNFLSEGLYELALELKHVPFLEKHVHAGLDARPVADLVVGRPVVSLPRVARASDARRVLRHTAHGAFPVVLDAPEEPERGDAENPKAARARPPPRVLLGLVLREHVRALLRHGPGLDDSARGAFPPDLATRLATSSYDAGASVRSRSAGDGAPAARFFPEHPLGRDSDDAPGARESSADRGPDHDLDLAPIMVRSPHVVYDDCPVSRAYRLFVTMGLRHLVVVDHRDNGVVGILTRKDLVACSHHKQDALHDGASTPVDLV